MTPLEIAQKALRDAETQLGELTSQRDDYEAQLSEAEAVEQELRRRRVPLAELAEAMRLTAAARIYVADTEHDAALLREQLPDLEARLEREEFLHDLGATADAATGSRGELDAELVSLAELIRPHLERITEINARLEGAREAYDATGRRAVPGFTSPDSYDPAWDGNVQARKQLEHEVRKRGHSLKAVLGPVEPPKGDDVALKEAFTLFQHVTFRYQQARQLAEAAAQAEQQQERHRRNEALERERELAMLTNR